MRKHLIRIFILGCLLNGCSDDDKERVVNNRFAFDNEVFSLSKGNLYLVRESIGGNNYADRLYVVTDGKYESGYGWRLDNYSDATYLLGISIATRGMSGKLTADEYPIYYEYPESADRIGEIKFEMEEMEYIVPDEVSDGTPIVILGNLDDNDIMTITFTGVLSRTGGLPRDIEGVIYYKGKVNDIRDEVDSSW